MNIYSVTNAEGQTIQVSGTFVTTYVQRVDTPEEAAYTMLPIGSMAPFQVQHRLNEFDALDTNQLARWGVTRTVIIETPPQVDPELRKSTVTQRLIALNKQTAVMDVLKADDGLFALWFAPDWQNVLVDDARVITIFQTAGLTANEIAQVLNPDPSYTIPTA